MKNMKQIIIFKFDEIFNDMLNNIMGNGIFNLIGDSKHKYSYETQKDRMSISVCGHSTVSIEIPLETICKFYKKRNYEVVIFDDEESLMMW